DEIDAIGGKRGVSKNDEKDQTLNKLLIELDGFKSSERIIVIAATNRIDMLDDALTRSGRFDKHIPIYLPDKKDRVGIFKVHLKNKKLNENIKIEYLAEITSGFSGADIATLVNEAAIIACVKNHEKIELDDIDEAYVKTAMKSNPKKDVSRSLKETQIVAYHEAGHAIVAKVLDNKVHKVTIVGTTSGVGGFTSTTGNESSLLSKEDFEKEIKILLGGRAAEYLLFNKNEEKITTGASNDIERSSKIINDMITKYGMFIKSPVVIKGNQSISNSSMYVPFKITDEIKNNELFNIASVESTRLYNETITILENNKKLLDKVANYLIEKETLTETELNMLISEIENEENIKNDNL
ncbi:MAG: AAA family ATPase, partial [Romboutsia sp.]|nr:AAA family ATPase [Romboutsia sp.]